MKSAMYEIVPNPFSGWDVREIKRRGTLRTFEDKKEAEQYLRSLAAAEPSEGPMVIDVNTGEEISNDTR